MADFNNGEFRDEFTTSASSAQPGGPVPEYSYHNFQKLPKKRGSGKVIALISLLLVLGIGTISGLGIAVYQLTAQPGSTSNPTVGEEHVVISPAIKEEGLSTSEIAAKAMPSVVGINIYSAQQVQKIGEASGIVLNTDGYIITNAHVVSDAAAVTVVLSDGSEHNAVVIGSDSRTDLAVVKVDPNGLNLVPAEFGDSTKCNLGDDVVAMGNAGGYYNSVTRGVISGLDREVSTSIGINLIQTDAAINPGNSGGALLNSSGQVIAINSSKLVGSEIDSMGFAIPINEAKPILDNLISYGHVKDRAQLGVTIVPLNATTGSMYGLPIQGLYITQISEKSNLFQAGITRGDVLVKANNVVLNESEDLIRELEKNKPGDQMTLVVNKSNGQEVSVTIILQDADTFVVTQ